MTNYKFSVFIFSDTNLQTGTFPVLLFLNLQTIFCTSLYVRLRSNFPPNIPCLAAVIY
jgi:hypothetical protein